MELKDYARHEVLHCGPLRFTKTFRIDQDLYSRMTAAALAQQVDESLLIRYAIRNYVEGREAEAE